MSHKWHVCLITCKRHEHIWQFRSLLWASLAKQNDYLVLMEPWQKQTIYIIANWRICMHIRYMCWRVLYMLYKEKLLIKGIKNDVFCVTIVKETFFRQTCSAKTLLLQNIHFFTKTLFWWLHVDITIGYVTIYIKVYTILTMLHHKIGT